MKRSRQQGTSMRSIEALLQTSEDLRAETADMIWIPGGTLRMGSDHHYPEEAPAHRVTVEPQLKIPRKVIKGGSHLCAELLPPLSPRGASCRSNRHLHQPSRLPLRDAGECAAMNSSAPSSGSMALTWFAVGLAIVLLVLGAVWYGVSLQVHRRFWNNIVDRLDGPMTFRLYLQPAMALIAAIPDGMRDARAGHKSFFWSSLWDADAATGRLKEGLRSIARVILLGLSMDVIYQIKELDQFYPAEAATMAILLAIIPYFVFRPIVEHVARWWFARHGPRKPA
jgi:Sulfatase-modifying factor enzyme 1